jgi:arylsulfatase A-like enzyme
MLRMPPPLYFPPWSPRYDRVRATVSSVDVLPSVLEYLGLPTDETHQGRSFMSRLDERGGEIFLEQHLIPYGPVRIFGLRDGRWKYIIEARNKNRTTPRHMLFDLEADPAEQNNLARLEPEITRSMSRRTAELRDRYRSKALPTRSIEPSDDVKEALKRMGYIRDDEEPAEPADPLPHAELEESGDEGL